MKKSNFLFLIVAVLTLSLFNSCTDDDDVNAPTLVVTQTGDTFTVGSIVNFEILVSSNEDLEYFEVNPSSVGGAGTGVIVTDPAEALIDDELGGFDFDNGLSSVTITYAYAIPAGLAAGTEVTIEFYLEDEVSDNSVTKSFTVVAGAGNVNRYTAVLMGSQANTTLGSFYSSSTNEVFSMASVAANKNIIDFVYYLGANDHVTIAAPNDVNAISVFDSVLDNTYNATLFDAGVDFTVADFTAAADDAIFSGITSSDTRVTDLSVNALIGFVTTAGKKGAFLVTGIDGTTYGESSTITIEVLVQE